MFQFLKSKKDGENITFSITGMHCTSCGMNIDGELEDTQGVIHASTSYAKSETRIIFDSKEITREKLVSVIEQLGYTVSEK